LLQAQAQVLELHQEGLDSEIPQVLKDCLLVTGAQQLEETFSLQKYEISYHIHYCQRMISAE
jgi:hypothetical protein